MPKDIRFVLIGLGNIGRNLLDVLADSQTAIVDQFGLNFILVGAVDSRGAAINPSGLDIGQVRDIKLAGQSVSAYPESGHAGMSALDMVQDIEFDMLMDASPTNLDDGEPGMSCVRSALSQGAHVIMANKGPLVLAFQELTDLAHAQGAKLLYSGTVAGGLPTVNLGVRDLAGSHVTRIEGIFNGTTNYILCRMAEEQVSYQEALLGAQEAGIAEPDPALDVDGWDAANKLVIIANSVLKQPTKLENLTVKGIREVTLDDFEQANARGEVIKLLAIAQETEHGYKLTVEPTSVPKDHPMGQTKRWDMGVVYYTDWMGIISAVIEEKGPVPTSAAVLRDMINVYR